jgi:hypothetical protein
VPIGSSISAEPDRRRRARGETLDQVIEFRVMPEIDLHRRHGLQDRPAAVRTSISLTI